MQQNLELEEAQQLLMARSVLTEQEQVPFMSALGRILSRDIWAERNIPGLDRSLLDGYALRARDTENASPCWPVCLKVIEEDVPAVKVGANLVQAGTAVKVMTGAPIPAGADGVIRHEVVERKDEWVSIFQPVRSGSNVIYSGEVLKAGERVAQKGMMVTSLLIGLFAGLGLKEVWVYHRLKAAILSVGDEVVDVHEPLSPGKIHDINRYTLRARCLELGVEAVDLGRVGDEPIEIKERIRNGLQQAQMVIVTGGVLAGDYDLVKNALKMLGATLLFWMVNIKPGSPVLAAIYDDKLIIGLTGNPASAAIVFDLLIVPLFKKMMGCEEYRYVRVEGRLLNGFLKPSRQHRFLRGQLLQDGETNAVSLHALQNNSGLESLSGCNLLVDVPPGSGPLRPGKKVSALFTGGTAREESAVSHHPQRKSQSEIPLLCIVSTVSNSGKTTLMEKLIREMTRRGYQVGAIKSDCHGFEIDKRGKDSWRFTQAGAKATAVIGPTQYALIRQTVTKHGLEQIASMMEGMDIILVEGFKMADKPKIQVIPQAKGGDYSLMENLVAIVTDDSQLLAQVPVFAPEDDVKLAEFIIANYIK